MPALDTTRSRLCCDQSLPCALDAYMAITDVELAGVPRLKTLLEVSSGKEFSRGRPYYEPDDDLNVYVHV